MSKISGILLSTPGILQFCLIKGLDTWVDIDAGQSKLGTNIMSS